MSFVSLPQDLHEVIFRSLGALGTDQARGAPDAACDILRLGATCKYLHSIQMVGIRPLEASCPKVVIKKEQIWAPRGGYRTKVTKPVVSDDMWDQLFSDPNHLSVDQLKDMVKLLPATGLLQHMPSEYGEYERNLIAEYTQPHTKHHQATFALQYHFGLKDLRKRPTCIPARIIAVVRRTRTVKLLVLPRIPRRMHGAIFGQQTINWTIYR